MGNEVTKQSILLMSGGIHLHWCHFKGLKSLMVLVMSGMLSFIVHNSYCQTNLANLINYSLKYSPEINKSNLDVENTKYIRKEALGHGLPQIEGSASYSKMSLNLDLPSSLTTYNPNEPVLTGLLSQIGSIDALYNASLGVQVTQLIYSQSYFAGLKVAKKTQEFYVSMKTKTEEDIIEEIANNYYQLLSLEYQLGTVNKSLGNLKETFRIVDLNYRNDLVKESNVNRLKVTLTNLEVTSQTLQNSIGLQLNYIKALVGMPIDTVLQIDSLTIKNSLSVDSIKFPSFSVDNVPAYQVLLKQDNLYRQQVKLLQAEYIPTLAGYSKFNYSSYNTSSQIDKLTNMNTIGIQLNVPILHRE